MPATSSNNSFPAPSKHDAAKKWLHKRLWKPASRQLLRGDDNGGVKRKPSLKRPQTAPTDQRTIPDAVPPVPQIPINFALPSPRLVIDPPPRPPRPDTGVIRDVNAWLDASTNVPPPPLMGGLPYWRLVSSDPAASSAGMQYATPIALEPGLDRPLTPSSQQVKSMCRRGAKKVQAKMPFLLRSTSQRIAARKQINRRSNSMPLLAVPYEQTRQASSPRPLTRSRSLLHASPQIPISSTPMDEQPLAAGQHSIDIPIVGSTRTRVTCGSYEGHANRRMHPRFRRNTRSGENTRPSTAGAHLSRDESVDLSMSEAPTYSSGPPPPSYRSRTASVMTSSSFGCVDGISRAQRHVPQQQAAMRSRGVRGRVKELRKIFQNE